MATDIMMSSEDTMTYIEQHIDIDLSIIPGEDIAVMANYYLRFRKER
jgi:hypothetical protein